jgi:hypothetical protein
MSLLSSWGRRSAYDPARIAVKIAVIVLAGVAAVAAVAAGVLATLYVTDDSAEPVATPCGDRTYGHIASLRREGTGYRMRFDPAWFTSGVTANVAAAEDGVVAPGEPVPNDNYTRDESHRLLTYLVPTDAAITVLTRQGDPASFGATSITTEELSQLVAGEKPVELFEPLETGVWIRVNVDTICAIDQQYIP